MKATVVEKFEYLQKLIESNIWQKNTKLFNFIRDQYTQLTKNNPDVSISDFGSPDFWDALMQSYERQRQPSEGDVVAQRQLPVEIKEEEEDEGVDIEDDEYSDEKISKCVFYCIIFLTIYKT